MASKSGPETAIQQSVGRMELRYPQPTVSGRPREDALVNNPFELPAEVKWEARERTRTSDVQPS